MACVSGKEERAAVSFAGGKIALEYVRCSSWQAGRKREFVGCVLWSSVLGGRVLWPTLPRRRHAQGAATRDRGRQWARETAGSGLARDSAEAAGRQRQANSRGNLTGRRFGGGDDIVAAASVPHSCNVGIELVGKMESGQRGNVFCLGELCMRRLLLLQLQAQATLSIH